MPPQRVEAAGLYRKSPCTVLEFQAEHTFSADWLGCVSRDAYHIRFLNAAGREVTAWVRATRVQLIGFCAANPAVQGGEG
jgi:hypothetical protein